MATLAGDFYIYKNRPTHERRVSAGCDKIAAAKPYARRGKGKPGRFSRPTPRASAIQGVHSDTHSSDTATERDARLRRSRELSPPFGRDALVDLLVRELVHQELTDSVCSARRVSKSTFIVRRS